VPKSLIARPPDSDANDKSDRVGGGFDPMSPPQRSYHRERESEAKQNATALLGFGDGKSASIDPSEGGVAGLRSAAVAGLLKNLQMLSMTAVDVPPEVSMWLDNLMQTLPQLNSQMASAEPYLGGLIQPSPVQSPVPAPMPPMPQPAQLPMSPNPMM
jgi:hypothetical protein